MLHLGQVEGGWSNDSLLEVLQFLTAIVRGSLGTVLALDWLSTSNTYQDLTQTCRICFKFPLYSKTSSSPTLRCYVTINSFLCEELEAEGELRI